MDKKYKKKLVKNKYKREDKREDKNNKKSKKNKKIKQKGRGLYDSIKSLFRSRDKEGESSNRKRKRVDSKDKTDEKERKIGFMDLPLETRKKIVPPSLLGSNYGKISLFEQGLNEQKRRRSKINDDFHRGKYNLFNLMNTINLYKELVKIDSNIEARRNNLARLKELQQLYITMQRDINIDDKSTKK
tara:strand:- start:6932 stop:7492 length:561 start_codon:yes stop_codon:yes gene_type:complete